MAQFRTTKDLVTLVLRRSGELEDGTSQFNQQAIDSLNQVHQTIITGGSEFETEVDEPWTWAKADRPIVIELLPKVDAGTVTFTQGSEAGVFSTGPTDSVADFYIKVEAREDIYQIASHTAGATAFEIDSQYFQESGTFNFKAFKLDYDLETQLMVVDSSNNKIDFEEVLSTEITATLTSGSYTPADLATEIKTRLDAAGTATYTVTYDALTRKFTILSDLAGPVIFSLLFVTGTNQQFSSSSLLGYDVLDLTGAATYTSVYIKDGITRLVQPARGYEGNFNFENGNVFGTTELEMQKNMPLPQVTEGIPTNFAIVEESNEGRIKIRLNRYPRDPMRLEFEYIPVPRDLQNNDASVPLLPRKNIQALIFGASYYVLFDKEDSKFQQYFQLAQAQLRAMVEQHKRSLQRVGNNFGNVIPRQDLLNNFDRRRLRFGEPRN